VSGRWVALAAVCWLGGCAVAPPAPEPIPAAEEPRAPLGEAARTLGAEDRLAEARGALTARNYRAALEASRAAATLNPHLPEARVLEAKALEASGDLPGALAKWEELVRSREGGAEALFSYAALAGRRGRGAQALALVESLAGERPEDPEWSGLLGWLALSAGRGDEARAYLEAAWRGPGGQRYAAYLGRARLQDGELAGAAEVAEAAAAQPGADATVWALLGDIRRAQGLAAAAEEAYRKALDLEPYQYAARVNLAVLRLSQGDAAGAEELAARAAQDRPDLPEAWTNLGLARRALGRYGEARDAYEQALAAAPAYAPALKNLGILNEKYLGLPAGALPIYERYLESRPGDEQVAQWRKAALRQAGQGEP